MHLSAAGGLAVVTIDQPPANALSRTVRAGLVSAFSAAASNPEVRAVLLRAAGPSWPSGGELSELDAEPLEPPLDRVGDIVEASPLPVVALLHGAVLGGGLELAAAAGARVALPGTSFGMPEVTLGLCPGAGGTRRLPALVGPKQALGLMLTGLPVGTDAAVAMGLIDGVLDEDALSVAGALALSLAAGGGGGGRGRGARVAAGLADPAGYVEAVAEARAGLRDVRLPAPSRIIDCVEAALLLPPPAAADFERAAFADLLATSESRGLRHAFLAERRAGDAPAGAGVRPLGDMRVALVGAGAETIELACAAALAGFPAVLADPDPRAVAAASAQAEATVAALSAEGRVGPDRAAAALGRLAVTGDVSALSGADLCIAATAADAALSVRLSAGTPVAILLPDEAAAFRAAAPEVAPQVVALTVVPPVTTGRAAEVIAPDGTDPDSLRVLLAVLRRLGRQTIVTHAPVMPALSGALWRAADRALERGADPYAIDGALVRWGFAWGPFALRDRIGLDLAPLPPAGSVAEVLWLRLMEEGRIGVATGSGFYRYAGHEASPDPGLPGRLAAAREAAGSVAGRIDDDEIVLTALAALAATGARLVEEGAAARPSDIDVAALGLLGFPRWRGGPMHAADEAGLLGLRNLLREIAREEEAGGGPEWSPVPLWDELVRNGRRFADLNR